MAYPGHTPRYHDSVFLVRQRKYTWYMPDSGTSVDLRMEQTNRRGYFGSGHALFRSSLALTQARTIDF